MKLSTLVLFGGIIAIGCLSCTPAPPSPPEGPAPRQARIPLACAQPFLDKVSVLKLPFSPEAVGANYRSPQPDPNRRITNEAILSDLGMAFCIAPPFLQQDLLSLSAIYINPCADASSCGTANPVVCDPNNCNLPDQQIIDTSWGFRERPQQSASGGRYIATSAGLWSGGNHAPDLDRFETRMLSQLLKWSGPQYQPSASTQGRPELTVLAVLAHETGHVRWYDVNARVPGQGYDPNGLCNRGFFVVSWQGNVNAPPRWRHFGDREGRHKTGDVQTRDIDNAIASNDLTTAGKLLDRMYAANDPWASFFSAISPDEDFIETYKFFALMQANPNLRSLPIQIPNESPQDVPNAYLGNLKQDLSTKTRCISTLPAPPSPPPSGVVPPR